MIANGLILCLVITFAGLILGFDFLGSVKAGAMVAAVYWLCVFWQKARAS